MRTLRRVKKDSNQFSTIKPHKQSNKTMSHLTKRFLNVVSFILVLSACVSFHSNGAFASTQLYITDHKINFGVGNKYEQITDVQIPGSGHALSFTRTYNSQSDIETELGYGWTGTFSESLIIESDQISLTQPGGRVVQFADDGTGHWINETGRKRTITSTANGYQLEEPSGAIKLFDSTGKILSKTDKNGNPLTYTYVDDDLIIANDEGQTLNFDFDDTSGNLISLTGPTGVFSYTYDENNNLKTVTKPDAGVIEYVYDDSNDLHNMTGIINEESIRELTVEYDTDDRVTNSSKATGESEVTISYPSLFTREVTDANGTVTTYTLVVTEGIVAVESFTGPGCSSCGDSSNSSYTYNDRLQVLTKTDGNDVITEYTYDDNGNKLSTTEATDSDIERTVTRTYTADNRVETITKNSVASSGSELVTSMSYDDNSNMLTRTENGFNSDGAISKNTTYTYNGRGQVLTIDGPRTDVNDVQTLSYYSSTDTDANNRNKLQAITNALGQTISFANYNAFGQAETITDANNQITTRTYNTSGLLASTSQGGRTTSLTYDKTGKLLTQNLPGGRTLTYSYTSNGQVEEITDAEGNYISYDYDNMGRKVGQTIYDPAGSFQSSLTYEYDTYSRLIKTITPDTNFQQYGYDAVNNVVSKIDQLSNETNYSYDALNRLGTIAEPGTISTIFDYDEHDNQIQVTDGNGKSTTYTYDDFGNILTRTSPDSGITTYEYDLAGNLTAKTDGNAVEVTYTYDVLNRLTSIHYPDTSQNVNYSYDENTYGIGRLSSVTDSTGSTSYGYDQFGNITSEYKSINSQNFTTTYGYNDNNELISITYPSARVISYSRNTSGNIFSVTSSYNGTTETIADNISYLPFGPTTAMDLGNGLSIANSYDQQYRLTDTQAGTIYDRSFNYYATGHVQTITDNISTDRSQNFVYDALGRLTSGSGVYGTESFTYDNIGNRLTLSAGGTSTSYNYVTGSNKLDEVTGETSTSYSYDEAGNTLSKGEQEYGWNNNAQLTSVTIDANAVGEYGYDARGLRTIQTTADETTLSVYDIAGNLITETDEDGNTIREFAYLNGQRLTLFDYAGLPTEFIITVSSSTGSMIENVKVYAFNENSKYSGINGTTDTEGQATFDREMFGSGSYTFRVDYLGYKFWSDAAVVQSSNGLSLIIEEEPAKVLVVMDGEAVEGVKVYAFTESGTYLGLYGVTDENGNVSFNLPEGYNYTFRSDVLGSKYWSETTTIASGGSNVTVNTQGGSLTFTVQEASDTPISGVKTYLFSESGAYLGLNSTSSDTGAVDYTVSAGIYKIRADYMGYQFWSESIVVAADSTTATLDIPHTDVTLTVQADESGEYTTIEGVKTYLFSPSGTYLGSTNTTDEQGQITYHVPEQRYKVRADYLAQQFWSEGLSGDDSTISIPHGTATINVTTVEEPLSGVKVYVFSKGGTYLGVNDTTDTSGQVSFILPDGAYRFRVDYQGNQFWGEDLSLIAHQDNPLNISTGGGTFVLALVDQDNTPLEDVRCYLFSESGTYLGEYGKSDALGQVGFTMADGSYKVRVDYMGYQYWTDIFSVPDTEALQHVIDHYDVTITSILHYGENQDPLEGGKVYLFTPAGTYLGVNSVSDANGGVTFSLPPQEYQVRVDYFGDQYWSEPYTQVDSTVIVQEGIAEVNLVSGSDALPGVSVDVFSESDSYLGLSAKTDDSGKAIFQVPAGLYKFRADYQASKFWATEEVVADTLTFIDLQTGGGSLAVTVRADDATVIAGVTCYLFSSTGTYLGQNGQTDESGHIYFDVADGSYQIRVDYLGYQYWSDTITAPDVLATSVQISHYDVAVTLNSNDGAAIQALPGVRCYLFTESGTYTGIYTDSDENGLASFTVPVNPYKVRADYMGEKYWTESFTAIDTTIEIGHGELELTVYDIQSVVEGAKVYLFTEAGSYLGVNGTTDVDGKVNFITPATSYKLRVDYNSTQYWTDVINVIEYQINSIPFAVNEVAATTTNNPSPTRYDGKGPVYMPMLASTGSSLAGMGETTASTLSSEATTYYYLSDHLGTSQLIVDDTAQVVWQGDYTPFGEVDVVIDELTNNFRFPGQILDPESGLYYNWHRFYDPETGRYVSADPIGLAGGMNLYAYVGGDPVNWIDPYGLVKWGQALSASYGLATNTAGAVLSAAGIVSGVALIVTPEPTSTVGGVALTSASLYGYGKSTFGMTMNLVKLVTALQDTDFDDPCTLEGAISENYYNGNEDVRRSLEATSFAIDLAIGAGSLNALDAGQSIYDSVTSVNKEINP